MRSAAPALSGRLAKPGGARPQNGCRRNPDPYALRPRRHIPPLPGRTVSSAGGRVALHDRPLHAPPVPRPLLRGGRGRRHRAPQRVRLYNGPVELAPSIRLYPVGGHTPGMQFVRVHTGRGWVVLASDVTHYYENMETGRPCTAAFHIGEMLGAYDVLRAHAPSPQHIAPGHDPLVMRRATRRQNQSSRASSSAWM